MRTVSWRGRGLGDFTPAWAELLSDSDADPLFNSPNWLTRWWQQYQPVIGAELDVRAVYAGDRLVGLALLHAREVKIKFGLTATRYELLGSAWRVPGVGFSEKTALILRRGFEGPAVDALVQSLIADEAWDELIVSKTLIGGTTAGVFTRLRGEVGGYLRQPDGMDGWNVPLEHGFGAFLAGLGPGTRARVMGSRKRLAEAGRWTERVLAPDELEAGWGVFSRLHESRWQRPFSRHWREFYGAVGAEQAARGLPVLSVLEFNGAPVSVLVNFRAARREYSITSAFVPVDVKRVSIGWMHLGLSIERACTDGMTCFDLLGGLGKNEPYKAAFGGDLYKLSTLQIIRRRPLAALYVAWDGIQSIRSHLPGSFRRQ